MATSPASLVICYSALCVLCMANLTCGQCVAKFDFLGVNHATTITTPTTSNLTTTTTTSNITLIIQKGSSLNVQFGVVTEDCFNDTDNHPSFTIDVGKRSINKQRHGYEVFCKIKLNASGTYTSLRPNECGRDDGGKGNFFLRKEDLDPTDETTWRLNAVSEDRKLEANATINLVVVYPPKVTALKFQYGKREDVHLQPLEPGTQLNISCTYDAGQPPVSKAALSITYGTEKVAGDKLEMKPRKMSRMKDRYKYSVEEVRCEDAGTVSCSVAGASKNISSTLLVKCPPRILGNRSRRFEGKVSQPLELLFPVYSYTASFTACTLTSKRLGPRQGQQEYAEDEVDDGKVVGDQNCSKPGREFSVFGTPPYLTLKLILHKLTPTDVGEKLLIVSNDAGSDDVQFDLQILHSKHPPKVTALNVLARNTTTGNWDEVRLEPLVPRTPLAIDCFYDAGKPLVSRAALRIVYSAEEVAGDKLREPKNKLKQQSVKAEWKGVGYLVEGGVSCDDAGTVSCRVAGASRNISSTLLVKCPPRILDKRLDKHPLFFEGNLSQPMDLLFHVYSHTSSFTTCALSSRSLGSRQGQQGHPESGDRKVVQSQNCSKPGREFSVFGTPPNLTMKLMFHKLTPADVGIKLLTISNDEGSDYISFVLQISHFISTHSLGDPGTPAEDDAGAGDDESNAVLITGIVNGATAVFILTCVVISVVVVKRRRCSCVPRRIFFRPGDSHRNVPSCYFHADHGSGHCPPVRDDSDTMYTNPDYHHPIPPPPPPRPPPPAPCVDDDSDTMYTNPDYHHPIPPPPPPRTPPPVACAEDYSEGSDTMYADADYLHPIAPSPTPPPAAGAESMNLSPLPPPLPSETKDINQSTEHTSQSLPPRKTRRLPSDRLPEPPHPTVIDGL